MPSTPRTNGVASVMRIMGLVVLILGIVVFRSSAIALFGVILILIGFAIDRQIAENSPGPSDLDALATLHARGLLTGRRICGQEHTG